MNRWPALILILAMVCGLVVLDRTVSPAESAVPGQATVQGQGPLAAPPGSSGSTWYCPAGFATPEATNDHLIIVTNSTDDAAVGTLTLFPSLLDTEGNPLPFEPAAQPLEVPARSQRTVSLAPLVSLLDEQLATSGGAFVAALAEFDGAGVTVEHSVVAFEGRDVGPCATSASSDWWFASGTTTADVAHQIYLLNPFPDDAVVDISFVTDAGSRTKNAFNGKLVPAQSLTVLQIAPEVPANTQMTAHVQVLTGRVIAERIQIFENEAGPSGLSLSLGANRTAEQWFFPAGRSVPGSGESYVIYNPGAPGEVPAEVEVELKPDSADLLGDVAPIFVPVGSGERWIVTVNAHPSHPVDALATIDASTVVEQGQGFFVSVRSFNGVPIVVEQVITQPAGSTGVTASLGVDTASTDQGMAIPVFIDGADAATLAILNPAGDTISRVQIFVGAPEGDELRAEVELAPRRRGVFDLQELVEPGDQWLRIVSSTGTMVEMTIAVNGIMLSSGSIAVEGTTSVPELSFD